MRPNLLEVLNTLDLVGKLSQIHGIHVIQRVYNIT